MDDYRFKLGTILKIWLNGYWHKGILLADGRVLHASKRAGRVLINSLAEFADSRRIYEEGYPGNLPSEAVVHRARRLIGQPYRLFSDNCEHLVTQAHGLPKQSQQVRKWVAVAAISLLAVVVLNRGRVA